MRSLFWHAGGNTSAMTIQQVPIETTERDRSALKAMLFQLGKELKSLADGVTRSLAVQGRVYTNVANEVTRLKDRHLRSAREVWTKLRDLGKKIEFLTDEVCRQHKETQQEIQQLRALIICMDHNDRKD